MLSQGGHIFFIVLITTFQVVYSEVKHDKKTKEVVPEEDPIQGIYKNRVKNDTKIFLKFPLFYLVDEENSAENSVKKFQPTLF